MHLPSYKLSLDSLYRPVTSTSFSFSNCSHLRGHNQNERSGQINVQQQKSFQLPEYPFSFVPNRIILQLVIFVSSKHGQGHFQHRSEKCFPIVWSLQLERLKDNEIQYPTNCATMFRPITFKDFIDFLSFIHVIQAAFVFHIYFFFVWIVLLVYCRHLPTDRIFNQKTLKYLHFDIVNESQEPILRINRSLIAFEALCRFYNQSFF